MLPEPDSKRVVAIFTPAGICATTAFENLAAAATDSTMRENTDDNFIVQGTIFAITVRPLVYQFAGAPNWAGVWRIFALTTCV